MSAHTLRSRVADLWRSFSFKDGCDEQRDASGVSGVLRSTMNSDQRQRTQQHQHDSFIHRYLNGETGVFDSFNGHSVNGRQPGQSGGGGGSKTPGDGPASADAENGVVPEIRHGKSCFDLPSHALAYMRPRVVAAHTGPNRGLCSVTPDPINAESSSNVNEVPIQQVEQQRQKQKATPKAFFPTLDTSMEFIDESSPKRSQVTNGQPEESIEVAGIRNWKSPTDFACGIATTLYECNPLTHENTGEPIADAFGLVVRENSAILAIADGVNWGEKSCLAAQCAIHGCIDYLNKALFGEAHSVSSTLDVFACLLRSFEAAHHLILQKKGLLTTLCACVVCPLEGGRFAVCVCNVGDSFAYIFSEKHGVREVTLGSHDIYSMRDMRDALGALGPVDGENPELNNLTLSLSLAEEGDVIFLTSDGISDNFDPVVGKFALAKKAPPGGSEERTVSAGGASGTERGGSGRGERERTLNHRSGAGASVKRSASHRIASSNERNSLPIVEAHQRHALTLLRMEDLLRHGVGGQEQERSATDARQVCERMVEFATRLTMAKRRILEDPELYRDEHCTNRERRQRVCQKLALVPGKLDHASLCAVRLGIHPAEDINVNASTSNGNPIMASASPASANSKVDLYAPRRSIAEARRAFFESSSGTPSAPASPDAGAYTTPEKNNNLTTPSTSTTSSSTNNTASSTAASTPSICRASKTHDHSQPISRPPSNLSSNSNKVNFNSNDSDVTAKQLQQSTFSSSSAKSAAATSTGEPSKAASSRKSSTGSTSSKKAPLCNFESTI
ncbi:PP2C-like domain-containing protein CG9801 [Varroa destructor]|uniref:PPM-type phosphatase domain-containing protein n=1 Tax=Varroa destructor TaxID=109461 RepID=A0A7M7JWB1_VARDE|nr:PP2C-like domain-containing protein CG9801 [Varroa destructor]XP_022657807.1 PP2C-like domain-containing protein CG9801 [Varroa destructor]XP_022657808.1 PP2C-like domain-containing protein CG9801 [Varroa destructor]